MGMLTVEDVLAATGGRVVFSNAHSFTGIAIDSRTIREGELFVALKGSRSDGHNFVGAALEKGNGALVSIEEITPVKDKTVIFTCRTGNRSGQVQHIFKQHGLDHVINHAGGIVSYRGEIEK